MYTINKIKHQIASASTVSHSHLPVMLPRNVKHVKNLQVRMHTESCMMLYLIFMSYLTPLIYLCTKLSLIQILISLISVNLQNRG